MSRLDAEYDPAEHHDLDRLEEHRTALAEYSGPGLLSWQPVCACGRMGWSHTTRGAAQADHRDHRDEEFGIGCP